ncbi:hypothetical protein AB0L00_28205 [Actinoallomurus sp. NPDC052308]|uniref:hypothetical protein n=1 Tax=Actinoallomurus sp. NPDC052308 TaxID=3155530 RepID=UPI003435C757
MRKHLNTFLMRHLIIFLVVSAIGFVASVLGRIGFDRVWEAGAAVFSSPGAITAFLVIMAIFTALVSTVMKKMK